MASQLLQNEKSQCAASCDNSHSVPYGSYDQRSYPIFQPEADGMASIQHSGASTLNKNTCPTFNWGGEDAGLGVERPGVPQRLAGGLGRAPTGYRVPASTAQQGAHLVCEEADGRLIVQLGHGIAGLVLHAPAGSRKA